MKKLFSNILVLALAVFLSTCSNQNESKGKNQKTEENSSAFVKTNGRFFEIAGKPYYFIGTNFWYGAILGSKGEGGDRTRLLNELDFMRENGINNLRILIGADGPDGVPSKVMPALQQEPGKYNEEIFDGLDFLLAEMRKREMYAVLYFTNSWEWSGGYSQYLNWTGHGKAPIPAIDGWPAFGEYVKQYANCEECKEILKKHIYTVINRTNSYTDEKYINDPTIMSWQIGNEPRAFSDENKAAYESWMKEVAAYIRSLDSNHLISTGSEGAAGTENDIDLYERIHADSNVDYLTMHIWPKNWGWLNPEDISGSIRKSIEETNVYIDKHVALARKHNKPIVMEEFGLPRDNHQYILSDPTTNRDLYYQNTFDYILSHSKEKDVFAGCNFWAWGGFARPTEGHIFWQQGDDYMGDPAQEEQGLNAVFDTDSTIRLIKEYASKLKESAK